MSDNTFGKIFKVTTFGESHGPAIGAVVDGMPAGVEIARDFIQSELDRRRPGNKAAGSTLRQESDTVEILSGVFENRSTGTPIGLLIRNSDQHSSDYSELKNLFRPGHADWGFHAKYGFRDHRGGGRSSGRETACRVAAGALAKLLLKKISPEISITAYALEIGGIRCEKLSLEEINNNPLRAADSCAAIKMAERIEECRRDSDSCGGVVECRISGIPAGWGEPVFDKLDALLAHAVFSIGAVKGFTLGAGFGAARLTGSENNSAPGAAGGIRGGISDGEAVIFQAAVKPTPSIGKEQSMPGTDGLIHPFVIKGRHDVCIVPRVVPVIEAMTAMVLADCALRQRSAKFEKFF